MNTTNVAVWGLGNHAINRILPALASIDEVKELLEEGIETEVVPWINDKEN